MASAQRPSSPKIYLRNYISSTDDKSSSPPYDQQPPIYQVADDMVYYRAPHAKQHKQKQQRHKDDTLSVPNYTDTSKRRVPSPFSEMSSDNRSKSSRSSRNPHLSYKRNRRPRIEDPDGYWVLPHAIEKETGSQSYMTPGGRCFSRTPKTHTAGIQVVNSEETLLDDGDDATALNTSMSNFIDVDMTEDLTQSIECLPAEDPDISITFHYNPTTDLLQCFGKELIVRLQATCRAYLAKKVVRRRQKEDDAVRTIQRTASLYFDPWFRLFIALRPSLRRHRLEDEILHLKSELEKFKAMVSVLRYENVAYQDKISRLLLLLEHMQPGGRSGDLVSKLIADLSMAVADHQKQWYNMVAKMPVNKGDGFGISPMTGTPRAINALDPITANSYMQASENAEFYRNQLEGLREEVDEQNMRTGQHYEEKIGVLSERVEQLQNMLTQEGFRSERISGELEAANIQLAEARETEYTLKGFIANLNAELARRKVPSISGPNTPSDAPIVATTVDNAFAAAPLPTTFEMLRDQDTGEDFLARKKLANIRNLVTENRELFDAIKDTALGPGGEFDIFSTDDNGFGCLGRSSAHSMNSIYHSQSHMENNYNYQRSQESETEAQLLKTKLDEEISYREDLEADAQDLRSQLAQLQRTIRRTKDEHEEELMERDQAHGRRVREMDDSLDELTREKIVLDKRCLELQTKIEELRQAPDLSDNETGSDDLRVSYNKLLVENRRYLKEIDLLRDEFEQYQRENNAANMQTLLTEKEEKISQLEVSQHHTSSEMEILNVRLQNSNTLLDENEQRLRGLTKEKQMMSHRMAKLESERDSAIREAASAAGKAGAERETASARQRELEELRQQRTAFQRDLVDMKVSLTEASTKGATEKLALERRIADLEAAANKREADLKADLDASREKVDNLQQELAELHKVESAASADNRHYKKQIRELQDSLDTYTHRVSELERRGADMNEELVRTQSNLSTALETANQLRDHQKRANEDYAASMSLDDDLVYSDEEGQGAAGGDGDVTASMYDIRQRSGSGGGYELFSGTQTVGRHRAANRQRETARSASRTGPLNPSSARPNSAILRPYGSSRQLTSTYRDGSRQSLAKKNDIPSNKYPHDHQI